MLRARLSEAQQAVADAGQELVATQSDAQADAAAGRRRCDEAQRALDEARLEANALGSVRKELELQNAAVVQARSGLDQARAAAEQRGAELRATQAMAARLPAAEAEACRQAELVAKGRAAQVAAQHEKQLESAREHQEKLSEELVSVRRTLDEERAKAEAQASQAGALQAEVQKLREAARATEAAVAAAATCRMPATS